MPDYLQLGVAGILAGVLSIGISTLWSAYQAQLKSAAAQTEVYTKLLVDLTVALEGLKQAIARRNDA